MARVHMRLLLIRHGETHWNRDGRYQGRSDPPLSTEGRQQARRLGAELAASGAGALVSSPLQRARETALAIGGAVGLEVGLEDGLSELSYGVWEGLTQEQVRQRWPEALRHWKQRPDAYPPTGAESLPAAAERIRRCLDHIALGQPSPVIAVTHAGVIRIAKLLSMGGPLADFRQVRVDNAEIVALDWAPADR